MHFNARRSFNANYVYIDSDGAVKSSKMYVANVAPPMCLRMVVIMIAVTICIYENVCHITWQVWLPIYGHMNVPNIYLAVDVTGSFSSLAFYI